MLENRIKHSGSLSIQGEKLIQERRLEYMVENCTRFSSSGSELNIYETHQQAEKVALQFNHPVLTTMLTGKKIMHFSGENDFSFLPGESLIVPSNKTMFIDFPIAQEEDPTRCLALVMEKNLIIQTLSFFNEKAHGLDGMEEWNIGEENFHLLNDHSITGLINHLIDLYRENSRSKDIFIDLSLKELIIRLIQSNARNLLIDQADSHQSSHRLAHVIIYINEHLDEPLHADKLSDIACLSKSHFFKMFSNHFGISPNQYIMQERMKLAESLMRNVEISVSNVATSCGFSDVSYFSKAFKKCKGKSPLEYRNSLPK